MATAKLVTLAIRTLAKPIATSLKSRATQHEAFRKVWETYRGSRSRAHARDRVDDKFEELQHELRELRDIVQHGHTPTKSDVALTTPKSADEQALHSLRLSTQLLWKLAERHGWLSDQSLVEEMHWALQDESEPNKQARIDSDSDAVLHPNSDASLRSRASHTPDASSGKQLNVPPTASSQATGPVSHESQPSQAPEASQTPSQESNNGSPSAQELGRQRAHAIIQEIRQQTSPTPIQLPSLDSMRSGSASIFGSLTFRLPTLHHDPRSFLQWTSPAAFEAFSSFT
ncbi:hypothetical protein MPSI1_002724 [Malassezia psittaci]|uniref:Uncharacterized protein n=1 Tax=Malassezia psittaci TaxID=1821823 RepID=A0AAF0FCQ6_9BASI|nr:hypothetical protein MPSI1_002724 [Malassezia psittaci]